MPTRTPSVRAPKPPPPLPWGGPRPNSGRKTHYPNKRRGAVSFSLTDEAVGILNAKAVELRVSRSDLLEKLIRTYGRRVRLTPMVGYEG